MTSKRHLRFTNCHYCCIRLWCVVWFTSDSKTIDQIQTTLQTNFNTVLDWLAVNKLSLNTDKTKIMLFTSQRSSIRNENLRITSGGMNLEQVENMKYLGVHLDRHLNFNAHVDNICKKTNQRTRLLWKMRNFITKDLDKYLYTTLINPIFTYCDFIYDGTSQRNKDKLQVKQNAALRAITRSPIDTSVHLIYADLQIDKLAIARRKSTLKMVYRGYSKQGPPQLNKMFENYVPPGQLRPLCC